MTKAILVVSFGTTYPETRKKTIEACQQAIQEYYPEYPLYRAFTSEVVIKRIKAQEGLTVFTVKQALEQMKSEGVREVYIQPLHIILGGEYDKVLAQLQGFRSDFDVLKLARPLLYCEEDYHRVKEILLEHYGRFGAGSACVLMGHGSQHHSFAAYAALGYMLQGTSVHIGCVESYPPVELIENRLKNQGITAVHLAPFMLVAGDHAINDMVSDSETSWKTYFRQKGYQVISHLHGLGEFREIQDLYLEHLKRIIE